MTRSAELFADGEHVIRTLNRTALIDRIARAIRAVASEV